MSDITVRELRNHGADVLERVARGEALTATRGQPIAELRPFTHHPIPAAVLVQRWRRLPVVDPARLRADLDNVLGRIAVTDTVVQYARGVLDANRDHAVATR